MDKAKIIFDRFREVFNLTTNEQIANMIGGERNNFYGKHLEKGGTSGKQVPFVVEMIDKLPEHINIGWFLYGREPKHIGRYDTTKNFVVPMYNNPKEVFTIPKSSIKTKIDNLVAIVMAGDSMAPEFKHQDVIIVDTDTREIGSGDILALQVNDNIFLRFVQFITKDELELIPTNKLFHRMKVKKEDIKVIGRPLLVFGSI